MRPGAWQRSTTPSTDTTAQLYYTTHLKITLPHNSFKNSITAQLICKSLVRSVCVVTRLNVDFFLRQQVQNADVRTSPRQGDPNAAGLGASRV